MRILISLLTWLLEQTVRPNRAGRLVPVPDDGMEPSFLRTLLAHWVAHWALWAAVALILLALAAGYLRRRWRAGGRPGQVRFAWLARGRGPERK
jgi:hypothetical protein